MTFQEIVSKHLFVGKFKEKENCPSPYWEKEHNNIQEGGMLRI